MTNGGAAQSINQCERLPVSLGQFRTPTIQHIDRGIERRFARLGKIDIRSGPNESLCDQCIGIGEAVRVEGSAMQAAARGECVMITVRRAVSGALIPDFRRRSGNRFALSKRVKQEYRVPALILSKLEKLYRLIGSADDADCSPAPGGGPG